MARGRGGKAKRGGGHAFSRNLVLDEDGVAVSTDKPRFNRRKAIMGENGEEEEGSGSEESTEEEESEEDSPEPAPAAQAPAPSTSSAADPLAARAARKAAKKAAQGKKAAGNKDEESEEDDDDLINPNHATPKNFKASDLSAPKELSRREREQKEKKEAQDRYWKAHVAGKTDQAKNDLARLAAIRKQREEAAAQRKAEAEAKEADIKAKLAASKQKR